MPNKTQKSCERDVENGEDLDREENNKTRKFCLSSCQPR